MVTYVDIQGCFRTICTGTGKMIQLVKTFTSKPDNLTSILGTHMVDEEKTDSLRLSFDLHTQVPWHTSYTEVDKRNKKFLRTMFTGKLLPEQGLHFENGATNVEVLLGESSSLGCMTLHCLQDTSCIHGCVCVCVHVFHLLCISYSRGNVTVLIGNLRGNG